jgi:NADH-ubiquinone oxidoreductase chain 5
LLFFFVGAIVFLIISPNLFMLLLGWDGLGLTSYLLVVYYMGVSRSVAGIVTFLVNRLGDVFFLFRISFLFFLGDWDFYALKLPVYSLVVFLVLAFVTKRAQIPFSSWLPAAIAAPTPVSALVHSSTLVTAGVFLLIRFYVLVLPFCYYLCLVRLLTLGMAGIMANYE